MQARIFSSRRLYAALAAGITAIATGVILGGIGPAFAQLPNGVNGYLNISDQDGPIDGEVGFRPERGSISVKGYNFSFHNSGSDICSPLTIHIGYDASWPILASDAVNYSPMQKVQLDLWRSGKEQQRFHQYTLNNAYLNVADQVDSYTMSLSFSASSVTEKTWPQKADGSLGKPIVRDISCSPT